MKFVVRIIAASLLAASMALVGANSAQASTTPKWLAISAGQYHTCGIKSDHSLWCWGDNFSGELGDNSNDQHNLPVQVGSSTKWVSVSAGRTHTCALHKSGSIYCWGANGDGQLGDGTNTTRLTPTKVGSSTSWVSVQTGQNHTCALHKSGSIYCWGYNGYGQLGIDSGPDSEALSPHKVGSSTSWKSVDSAGGSDHTCALHKSGSIYCWGRNNYGQLGIGNSGVNKFSPTKVGSSTSWTSVQVSGAHTCATHSSGSIYCWGANEDGQLGTGDTTPHSSPTKAGSSTSWKAVTLGQSHTCARHSSGAIYCWGNGVDGALGNGTSSQKYSPTKAGSSTSWVSVSAGGYHTCAISSSGYAYCSGLNVFGELGLGDTDGRNSLHKITELTLPY